MASRKILAKMLADWLHDLACQTWQPDNSGQPAIAITLSRAIEYDRAWLWEQFYNSLKTQAK